MLTKKNPMSIFLPRLSNKEHWHGMTSPSDTYRAGGRAVSNLFDHRRLGQSAHYLIVLGVTGLSRKGGWVLVQNKDIHRDVGKYDGKETKRCTYEVLHYFFSLA